MSKDFFTVDCLPFLHMSVYLLIVKSYKSKGLNENEKNSDHTNTYSTSLGKNIFHRSPLDTMVAYIRILIGNDNRTDVFRHRCNTTQPIEDCIAPSESG